MHICVTIMTRSLSKCVVSANLTKMVFATFMVENGVQVAIKDVLKSLNNTF